MPSVLAWKTIKPARLKDKEMQRELRNAMARCGRAILKDYQRGVKTWEERPEFETATSLMTGKPPGPSVLVGTDDLVYLYVDEGTKPHEIWAGAYTGKSEHKVLSFQGNYRSKTDVDNLDAHAGGASGDWAHPPMVNHPGTKARNFTKIIQKTWQPRFKDEMEAAMIRAAQASGHGK
jgi:hypothetical protein